ncbi:CBL-interacting serine/threonine-protein kinase 8 [Tritrichomonas foetus]|uniref:non-specific serine/threonine protein kinase n=1 Tax=Tritrichomonas foetus TaxID=1144522 RepID=A0A1J4JU77_9EUKA|nr:CBL-interacting serine/threonine-protein kinase 8 [Tritrichomonas foetus]|eukprot:OHT02689.1 CBL-interacting serine/threonine-protein kinase 8 [Tritrichomonas foetus]
MSQVLGDYRILETIGEGASSKVRLAQSLITGKLFAMKIISKKRLESDENLSKQVKREIEIMNQLDHPSIVKLHGVLESKKNIYLILDYAAGGELFEKLKIAERFDEDIARSYFQQLIDAISYMHSKNAIHRDLKLENLLLDENGALKVADFGLSIMAKNSTDMLKTRCGTPYYVAPEIFSSTRYAGPPTDVWSCGVILYTMLTGEFPFDGISLQQLAQQIMRGIVTFPSYIPFGAIDLMRHIFLPNPNMRYTIDDIKKHPWFAENYKPTVIPGETETRTAVTKTYSDIKIKIKSTGNGQSNESDINDYDEYSNKENSNKRYDDDNSSTYSMDSKDNDKRTQIVLPNAFELIGKLCSVDIGKVFHKGSSKNIVSNNFIFSTDKDKVEAYDIIDTFLDAYNAKSKRSSRDGWSFSAKLKIQNDVVSFGIELIDVGFNKILVNIIRNSGSPFHFARIVKSIKIRLEK